MKPSAQPEGRDVAIEFSINDDDNASSTTLHTKTANLIHGAIGDNSDP